MAPVRTLETRSPPLTNQPHHPYCVTTPGLPSVRLCYPRLNDVAFDQQSNQERLLISAISSQLGSAGFLTDRKLNPMTNPLFSLCLYLKAALPYRASH